MAQDVKVKRLMVSVNLVHQVHVSITVHQLSNHAYQGSKRAVYGKLNWMLVPNQQPTKVALSFLSDDL